MGKVWRNVKSGDLFHDECFEPGESREGFLTVQDSEIDEDEECSACMSPVSGDPDPDPDDNDDELDDEIDPDDEDDD